MGPQRECELRIELALEDVDVRWLEFLRWLIANGRDPEHVGVRELPVLDEDVCAA